MDNNKPDLSQLKVEVVWRQDMWQMIKDAALFTIHKKSEKYPDSNWKRRILMAEHSPIRSGKIIINVYNCPQFVHGHLVRHSNGLVPFISSLRADRMEYDETPNRNTLQDGRYDFNFQTFINMSRKRYCNCASEATRYVWAEIMKVVKEHEPELYSVCKRECVYRNGLCPEMFTCKYNKTEAFKKELKEYTQFISNQICDETNINLKGGIDE